MADARQQGFYLGRRVEPDPSAGPGEPILYDPADLTTHAVVVGMTGSGKTGLCIGVLEEAALHGIPALLIDPKGDLTNLALHFPNLSPADFEPWLEADAARRTGKSVAELAEETAGRWRDGLAQWGITAERITRLSEAVRYAVYTPGSDAGLPVSILASLNPPEGMGWEGNREVLRERISSTVTALLGLVGLKDIDPVRSREHILLANIFEHAWSQGKGLDLTELILQTQTPPFDRLGVFPLDNLFPGRDRLELAMLLNNFLAAPAFQTWREGEPLDVAKLLYTPEGQPRHSIFYLAHLGEEERMFFTTLLLSAVDTWMRTQAGTTGLRALVYFDEILGYLPPVGNPPSKPILLRLLKQARAFGVGLLLASQNPVDIDYKALSNAGTWFVGKLQTEQDKQRLLDGLQGAAAGLADRSGTDRLLSSLAKRVFLLHNVHESGPVLLQTRWTMNFLAGPLTRAQIPQVNRLVGAAPAGAGTFAAPMPRGWTAPQPAAPAPVPAPAASYGMGTPPPTAAPEAPALEGTQTRPALPATVAQFYLPSNHPLDQAVRSVNLILSPTTRDLGLLYRPALFAQATVRYLARKYNLDSVQQRAVLVPRPDRSGMINWEQYPYPAIDPDALGRQPFGPARYAAVDQPLTDARRMASLEKDFVDWVYRTGVLHCKANESLKVYAGPETSLAQFREQTSAAARQACELEINKSAAAYDRKLVALHEKLAREERELQTDEDEANSRKMEEWTTHAGNLFGVLGGKRRSLSSSVSKRRLTQKAQNEVQESRALIQDLRKQVAALEAERNQALQAVNDRWAQVALETSEITITPMKKDIFVDVFGVLWMPYYVIQSGEKVVELPAFQAAEG